MILQGSVLISFKTPTMRVSQQLRKFVNSAFENLYRLCVKHPFNRTKYRPHINVWHYDCFTTWYIAATSLLVLCSYKLAVIPINWSSLFLFIVANSRFCTSNIKNRSSVCGFVDDCGNIARILKKLAETGHVFQPTGSIS